jgi:hypothetical protein
MTAAGLDGAMTRKCPRLTDGSLDSAAVGSDMDRQGYVRASYDITAATYTSIFATFFMEDSYGVHDGDHDSFGEEALNLPCHCRSFYLIFLLGNHTMLLLT